MYQLENVFVKLDTFFKRILGPRYKWILAILFRYMTATKTIGRYFWYLNIFIAMFYYIIILLKINIDLDIESILLLFYFIATNLLHKVFDFYDYILKFFNKIIDNINAKLPSKDDIKRAKYPSTDKLPDNLPDNNSYPSTRNYPSHDNYPSTRNYPSNDNYPIHNKKVLEPMNKTFECVKDSRWYEKFIPNYSLSDIPTWFWVISGLCLIIGIAIFWPNIIIDVKDWLSNYFFPKPGNDPDIPPMIQKKPIVVPRETIEISESVDRPVWTSRPDRLPTDDPNVWTPSIERVPRNFNPWSETSIDTDFVKPLSPEDAPDIVITPPSPEVSTSNLPDSPTSSSGTVTPTNK